MTPEFIIFDTEYTSWKGCNEKGWVLPQRKEIVQIAALQVKQSTLEVKAEFNILIRPTHNPILSDYFIKLTGITNEQIASEGVDFKEGLAKFIKFVGNRDCISHVWSGDKDSCGDGEVIKLNLEYNNLPKVNLRFKNIAPWFRKQYQENNIIVERQASGQIAKIVGRDEAIKQLGLNEHNALYDVYSLLEGIRKFHGKDLDSY